MEAWARMDAENSQSDGIAANHSRMQVLIEGTAWVSKQPHHKPREVAKVGDSMRLEGMNETLRFKVFRIAAKSELYGKLGLA